MPLTVTMASLALPSLGNTTTTTTSTTTRIVPICCCVTQGSQDKKCDYDCHGFFQQQNLANVNNTRVQLAILSTSMGQGPSLALPITTLWPKVEAILKASNIATL
jgi:hypothetical protein